MKIKKILFLFVLFCVLSVPFVFTGCGHTHTFAGGWNQYKAPTCTEDGVLRRDCIECDYYETAPVNKLGHDFGEWEEWPIATCNNDGEKHRECSRCGYEDTEITHALQHEFSNEYAYSASTHYYQCKLCLERKDEKAHVFDAENGTKCSVCGYKMEDIFNTKVQDDGLIITGYKGDINTIPEQIIIPDEIGGRQVIGIGDYAFSSRDENTPTPLKKVVFGKNIKSIGLSAFWGNGNLQELELPENLEVIGLYAFSRCVSITKVKCNDKLQRLEQEAFWGCSGLTSLDLKNVKSIGQWAFSNCIGLHDISFNNLEYLGISAFYGCKNLKNINLGHGNLTIDEWAFTGCEALKNVEVSENIVKFSDNALYLNENMKCYVKDDVKYLGNEEHNFVVAVDAEPTIKTYSSEPDTRIIFRNAFYSCQELTDVKLSDNVVGIGKCAFTNCTNLTSLTLGANINSINDAAFNSCNNLSKVYASSIESWLKINFVALDDYGNNDVYSGDVNPLYYGADLIIDNIVVTNVNVPSNINEISPYAFAGYVKLESVSMGNNVNSIGNFAFLKCKNITSFTINEGNAKYSAKNNCVIDNDSNTILFGFSTTTIPDGVETIGDYAFWEIQFPDEGLTIANSVTKIGKYAFCSAIIPKITMGTGLQQVDFWAFAASVKQVYISDFNKWCGVELNGELSSPIKWESQVFIDGENIGNSVLKIPEGVEEIKPWVFANTQIYGLSIPSSTTKIDSTAFARACNLGLGGNESLTVDERNTALKVTENKLGLVDKQTKTLLLCLTHSISVVDFSNEDFETVGAYSFSYKIIYNVILPSSVRKIENSAFDQCRLKTIELNDGLERIEESAFSGNDQLTSIVIPASVNFIGENAFTSCGIGNVVFNDPNNWTVNDETHSVVDAFADAQTAAEELLKYNRSWQKTEN